MRGGRRENGHDMIDESAAGIAATKIAEAFELGKPIRMAPAAAGAMGRVWRLDTTTGTFAVKESLWAQDLAPLRAQLEFSALVCERARRAGVVAPEPRRTWSGSLSAPVQAFAGREPTQVRVASWIDGRPCDAGVDGPAAAAWLGETLATLEMLADPPSHPAPDEWLASWFTEVASADQWLELVRRAQLACVDWAGALDAALLSIAELSELVGPPPSDRLTVSHTDLQPKNVLIVGAAFALLDWDDVAQVSRDRVLARALVDWHLHGTQVDSAAMVRTLAAYRRRGGTGIVGEPSDFGDVVAGFLNYLLEQVQVSLDRPHSGADARAASERVTSMLRHPLSMAMLGRVLDVVRAC